jgi:zinc/manganese transport system permease protein
MSLIGDTLGHAVLPGVAAGFLVAGLSLPAMGLGGLIAGLTVALLSGLVTRATELREDASFAGFYLTSLALGVMIISARGSNVDVLHVLFGTVLSIDSRALLLIGTTASVTMITLAVIYRPLVIECFDPSFLRVNGGSGSLYHFLFLALVVINLVASFQVLGTLMSVGLMMLPAAAARLAARTLPGMILIAAAIALTSGYAGLLLSFHLGVASGPAIVLAASAFYFSAILFGQGGLFPRMFPARHRTG